MESRAMFHSLEEEIKSTEAGPPKAIERLVCFVGIAVLAVVVLGEL
jgi:hypothetical protein